SRSRVNSAFRPCWCRDFPASPRVWAASSRQCGTILSRVSANRSPMRRPGRLTAASPIRLRRAVGLSRHSDDRRQGSSLRQQLGAQSHVFRVTVYEPGVDRRLVHADFLERYKAQLNIKLHEMTAILVTLRTTVIGRSASVDLATFAPAIGGSEAPRPSGARQV